MGRVILVGAGVVGLSCAIRLSEAGHRVDVLARDLPRETTSVVAAALWYPYLAFPEDRVRVWGAATFAALSSLVGEDAGVRMLPGTEVLTEPTPDPAWAASVPGFRRVAPLEGYADAWSFASPLIDMPVYLDWLRARLGSLGGTLTRMSLGALPEPGADEVVVNCAGMGARLLAADPSVHPVRGQVVLLRGVTVDRWWLDESGPTYVIPRTDTIVVGGTEQHDEWSRTASPETATDILRRATRLVPELASAEVVAHRVGLRPARPEVRLEVSTGATTSIGRTIHCYGHGGAGVTLSWGCADEVARLVGDPA